MVMLLMSSSADQGTNLANERASFMTAGIFFALFNYDYLCHSQQKSSGQDRRRDGKRKLRRLLSSFFELLIVHVCHTEGAKAGADASKTLSHVRHGELYAASTHSC